MKKLYLILILIIILNSCVSFLSTIDNEIIYRVEPKIYYCFYIEDSNIFYWFFIYQEKYTKMIYKGNCFIVNSEKSKKIIGTSFYKIMLRLYYNKKSYQITKIDCFWQHSLKKSKIEIITVKTKQNMINYLNKKASNNI